MSVLIKGMKMPKNCDECPLADSYLTCDAQSINCPLVEVPTPHGRLIDADALIKVLNACKYSVEKATMRQVTYNAAISDVCRNIDRLPAIIEAEEGEGE